jgi:Protein of unknown function (DUF3667)
MRWTRSLRLRPVPSTEVRGIMLAAVDGRCTNCEKPLAEPRPNFCPECGQDTNLNPPTLREFWAQFTDTYLAPRGAMGTTLKMLLLRPGELTAQYLTGRRRQYVLPLRLFGLATLVMLVVMRVVSVIELSVLDDPDVAAALAQRPSQVALELGVGRAGVTEGRFYCEGLSPWLCKRLQAKLDMSTHDLLVQIERVSDRMARNAGLVMLVLLPAFAGVLTLLYRYRGMGYTEHLVFALHLHSFWFFVVAAVMLAPVWLLLPGLMLILAYAGLAFRRVYGGRAWGLVWRGALLSAVHMVLVIGIVAVTALAALLV